MAPRLPARALRRPQTATLFPSVVAIHPISTPIPTPIPTPTPIPHRRAFSQTAPSSKKYGWSTLPSRSKPTRFNQRTAGIPAPTTGPAAALQRKERTTPLRTGVLAVKKGMTAIFGTGGSRVPGTVLQLDGVQVVAARTRARNGYWAVQVGIGARRAVNVGQAMLGYYEAKGLPPKRTLAEFRVRGEDGLLPAGVELGPDWFAEGQFVDCRSTSRGMGFAGGMKRWGFSGQEASHGNSKNHRTIGTVGPSQGSGSRVLPGKKMPGRMGGERVTLQNLKVLKVDTELGIVVVKGHVAGPKGCVVKIQDAIKKGPPPQEHIDKMNSAIQERHPNVLEQLDAARQRHAVLKELRKEGRITEVMKAQ